MFRSARIPLMAASLAAALTLAACGKGPTPPACDDACLTPPPPTCTGEVLVTWSVLGECVDGACQYAIASEVTCDEGCADGACVVTPDPCDGVDCETPPAASCDGDVVTRYSAGTCTEGACNFPSTQVDCAVRGQICADGECVLPGLCDGVDCGEPPDAECRGRTAIVWTDGVCDPATGSCEWTPNETNCASTGRFCRTGECVVVEPCDGIVCDDLPTARCDGSVAVTADAGECDPATELCRYPTTERDCFDEGLACEAGECVPSDRCDGVVCDDIPAPRCDGDTAVVSIAAGRCDPTSGLCRPDEERTDCGATGQICANGTCIDAGCDGVVCSLPPADRCEANVAVSFATTGTCGEGRCSYPPTRTDCTELDRVCAAGRCVEPDPCTLIACDAPPAATCDGDFALQPPAVGACAEGECSYPPTRVDCAASGLGCLDGRCVDRCTGITCDETPAPYCIGDVLRAPTGGGVCQAGLCRFSELEVNCAATGQRCLDGGCRNRCYGVTCDEPPADYCENSATRVAWSSSGVCNTADGSCRYTATSENCVASGRICIDGQCVTPPCQGVTCDAPDAPYCEGDTLVSAFGSGVCQELTGVCAYPVSRQDCTAEGGDCRDGRCRDVCEVLACDTPPAPTCSGDTVVAFGPGPCNRVARECNYPTTLTNCATSGLVCRAGACVDPPCLGVTCETPAAPFCDGDTAVAEFGSGTCDDLDGSCTYAANRRDCTTGRGICRDGECLEPCEFLTCDAPPADVCVGDLLFDYGAGACDTTIQDCRYEPTFVACGDDGLVCRDGACREPLCRADTCDVPPAPTCEGTVRVTPLPGGLCTEADGSCLYANDRFDCAALGQACDDGRCVSPCEGVTCNTPPASFCDGLVARSWRTVGTCNGTTGVCGYDAISTNCALTGELCRDGACVPNPCDGVTCASTPPSVCAGNTAVVYFDGTGECNPANGACIYASVPVDCAATGQQCVDGTCTSLCTGVDCSTPPADFCSGNIAVTYPGGGACDSTSGNCAFSARLVPCTVGTEVCSAGRCVPADACETAVCETPPESVCDGTIATVWSADGTCVDGACEYTSTSVDCATIGRFCDRGICVATDPCIGVECNEPPGPSCIGDVAVSWTGGNCSSGDCEYSPQLVDCAASGERCELGRCYVPEPCDGGCVAPPADRCVDGNALLYSEAGNCIDDACVYPVFVDDCEGRGLTCVGGACVDVDPCEGVACNAAPEPFCNGNTVVSPVAPGVCIEGACFYGAGPVLDCTPLGSLCRNGVCEPTECTGITCPTPAAECATETVQRNFLSSSCVDGTCVPLEQLVDCAAADPLARCYDGACLLENPCDGVVCNTPSPAFCDGNTAVSYRSPGRCAANIDGRCIYDIVREDCSALDGFCFDGACGSIDPCADVVCNERPEATCNYNLRLTYPVGVCAEGLCSYPETAFDCGIEGLFCFEGECQEIDPCAGLNCDTLGTPFCRGNLRVTQLRGNCNAGLCERPEAIVDCAEGGGTCVDGQCVGVDPCFGISCNEELPPTCRGDVSVTFAPSGTCSAGVCRYAESTVNCAASGLVCANGLCGLPASGLAVGDVIVTEVLRLPASQAFVELFNNSGRRIDLRGLTVSSPTTGLSFSIGTSLVVEPEAFVVLGASATAGGGADFVWPGSFRFSGTAQVLRLRAAVVLDDMPLTADWPDSTGVSAQLDDASFDETLNDDRDLWCASTLPGPVGQTTSAGSGNETCPEVVPPDPVDPTNP